MAVFLGYSDLIGNIDPEEASGGEWCSLERAGQIVEEGKATPWLRDGYRILKALIYPE